MRDCFDSWKGFLDARFESAEDGSLRLGDYDELVVQDCCDDVGLDNLVLFKVHRDVIRDVGLCTGDWVKIRFVFKGRRWTPKNGGESKLFCDIVCKQIKVVAHTEGERLKTSASVPIV